jgi:hypothetical protein
MTYSDTGLKGLKGPPIIRVGRPVCLYAGYRRTLQTLQNIPAGHVKPEEGCYEEAV